MPLKKRVTASVAELLNSATFLESLSPKERIAIITAARSRDLPASPNQDQQVAATKAWASSRPLHEQQQEDDLRMHLLQCPDTAIAAVHQAFDALEVLQRPQPKIQATATEEDRQLREKNQLLQRQKSQLQAQITSLQYQVSMLLANYKAAESQGNQRLAALEAVITRLQITMTDVGATAARVARENKLLSAENRQLTTERAKHLEMQQQLQAHCQELEVELLTRVSAAGQQAAEAAAIASSPLNALLTPELLAATALPPGANTSNSTTMVDSSSKIVPALQEIAALKRGRDLLQKQVVQLQQQLSASENAAQTAATAAAAERARSNKSLAKTRQQLTAAVQRLHHMADREQQQQVALQERQRYITKLEQALLDQHQQLGDRRAAGIDNGRSPSRSHSASGRRVVATNTTTASTQGFSSSLFPSPGWSNLNGDQQKQQQQRMPLVTANHTAASPGNAASMIDHGTWAFKVNAGACTVGRRASLASPATAERLLQHGKYPGHIQRLGTGSSAANASDISPGRAGAVASPDMSIAAKRSAVARQCVEVMLSGGPEGSPTRRAAATVKQANTTVVPAAVASKPGAVSTRQAGGLQPSVKSGTQQDPSGLQQLQQSRLQQWQQRQMLSRQQVLDGAADAVSCGQNKATESGAWEGRRPGRQSQQGIPLLSKQQTRQQRLRELLHKQQRTRPQQIKLRTARPQQQQQQQGGLLQEPQQQCQQRPQQQWMAGEECQEEAQAEWQQLQQQVLQTLAHTAPGEITEGGGDEEHDAGLARTTAASDHVAAAGVQQGQKADQQPMQDWPEPHHHECSDEEPLATPTPGQPPHGMLGEGLRTAVKRSTRLLTEEQLVAQVLEMQHNMQLLKGQLLQLGSA